MDNSVGFPKFDVSEFVGLINQNYNSRGTRPTEDLYELTFYQTESNHKTSSFLFRNDL